MKLFHRLLCGLCGVVMSIPGLAVLALLTDLNISEKSVPPGLLTGFILGLIFPKYARLSFLFITQYHYDKNFHNADDRELAVKLAAVLAILLLLIFGAATRG